MTILSENIIKNFNGIHMTNILNDTVKFYNQNASNFYETTVNVNMEQLYSWFEQFIRPGMLIMDLGCGSGRDTLYFLNKGYQVVPVEPSSELAGMASHLCQCEVICKTAEQLDYENHFDGIWACSSLLHIPFKEMNDVLMKLHLSLKPDGVLFISVKVGEFEGMRNGRYFCDYTLDKFEMLNYRVIGFEMIDYIYTEDKRPERQKEKWLSIILKKC